MTVLDLVIVGAGGHGRELLDVIEAINARSPEWLVVGVLADEALHPERLAARGVRAIGRSGELAVPGCAYALGVGSGSARRLLDALAAKAGRAAPVLVHPQAVIGGSCVLEEGVVLAAGSIVTTNVALGRHTHLNVGASVSHDSVIGAYCTIGPGARVAGECVLEEGVELGIGAVVRPGVRIGAGTLVGAGAAVVSDLPSGVVAAGVPARSVRPQLGT
jgi:sugar O-acyltransferase (sialic acid O-acetyltransferase NeuD family)